MDPIFNLGSSEISRTGHNPVGCLSGPSAMSASGLFTAAVLQR